MNMKEIIEALADLETATLELRNEANHDEYAKYGELYEALPRSGTGRQAQLRRGGLNHENKRTDNLRQRRLRLRLLGRGHGTHDPFACAARVRHLRMGNGCSLNLHKPTNKTEMNKTMNETTNTTPGWTGRADYAERH